MQSTQTTSILIKPWLHLRCVSWTLAPFQQGNLLRTPGPCQSPFSSDPKAPPPWNLARRGTHIILSSYHKGCPGVSHLQQAFLVPNSGDSSPASWETEDKKSARTKQQFRLERKHALMASLSPGTAESFLRLLLLQKYIVYCVDSCMIILLKGCRGRITSSTLHSPLWRSVHFSCVSISVVVLHPITRSKFCLPWKSW